MQARRSQLTEVDILSRKENDRWRIQARRSQLTEAEIQTIKEEKATDCGNKKKI